MGRKNQPKSRMIPQQDKRICGSICLCQLIVVFSCVSLIYLTVAIYIPAYRAFNSGFETRPVMCQTVNTSIINNCSWASCGEWCLTKTSGFCPQIYSTTRQNGTTIQLRNCRNVSSVSCPQVNNAALKKYNCNNGTECATLLGVFNCSLGHCLNLSQVYQCHHKADGLVLDSDKDNVKLNGFFECKGSRCTKIRRAFSCDRYCEHIPTKSRNVYITTDDNLYTASCDDLVAHTEANGKEEGRKIEPRVVWERKPNAVLIMSCHTVTNSEKIINATDCINGTIYDSARFAQPSINFTVFWRIANDKQQLVDATQRFLPMQNTLTIYNSSRLFINLEGCVNTLKGECKQFWGTHGRDGRNQTAQSRFPCFYNKANSFMVLARYDLDRTWTDLLIAVCVPSALFVVSFVTLCIIMQCVKVGDDTKMRCKYCVGNTTDQDFGEMTMASSKYEMQSPTDGPHKKDNVPLVKT